LIDKRTVFVLGAGASCPYGYLSGSQLRTEICFCLKNDYYEYFRGSVLQQTTEGKNKWDQIDRFVDTFKNSSTPSIDLFMARNHNLAEMGKYIIAYQIFKTEHRSCFGEDILERREHYARLTYNSPPDFVKKGYFQGDDWYSHLFRQITARLSKPDILPDFSDDKISFITFNYDRSLEHYLFERMRNSFTEIPEQEIFQCLKKLKVLHVYGQIVPLKWQDSELGIDYRPPIDEPLLLKAAPNIKTIYEQEESPELNEIREILAQADRIFFLGFGYAPENMEILKLSGIISKASQFYGTAFGLEEREVRDIHGRIFEGLQPDSILYINPHLIKIEKEMDCLKLLKNYF
jgi:hypothetical protein